MWPLVSGSSGWTQWPGVVATWWLPNALCTDVLLPTQHLATMGNQFPLASLLTYTAGQASEGLEQSSTGGWSQEPAATSQHAWQPSSPHPNASTAGLCCIWGYGTAPAVLQSLGATKCPGQGAVTSPSFAHCCSRTDPVLSSPSSSEQDCLSSARCSVPSTPLTYTGWEGPRLPALFLCQHLPDQPLSSRVAQPIRNGAEARTWVSEQGQLAVCISKQWLVLWWDYQEKQSRLLQTPSWFIQTSVLLCSAVVGSGRQPLHTVL